MRAHSRQLLSHAYFYRVKVHRRPHPARRSAGARHGTPCRIRLDVHGGRPGAPVPRVSAIAFRSRARPGVMSVQHATTLLIEFKPFPVV
jgi:hypothetical protein